MNEVSATPRSVIVTGAAGGIGTVFVRALLCAGHAVAAVDRDAGALEVLCAAMAADPSTSTGRLVQIRADLAAAGAADLAVADAFRQLGHIDTLVNNAGLGGSGYWERRGQPRPLFWEVDDTVWNAFMEINAGATFRMARAAAPHLTASGRGRVVNITTSLLTMLGHKMNPYGPSKAAAESLTAIMAEDFKGTGTTANVLIPGGPTDTPMVSGADRTQLLPPDVMVPPLLWLLSDEAAGVTGRRFVAHLWDASADGELAAERAGAPAAWAELAAKSGRVGNLR